MLPGEPTAPNPGSENTNNDRGKYRFGSGQRRLPRPIVFWSDNERDAFRRNKILQTHYYIKLDDIETQRRASKRAIKFEAYKFRERSGRLQNKFRMNLTGNIERPKSTSAVAKGSHDKDGPTSGDGVAGKKSTVRFSVFKEYIPNEDSSGCDSEDVETSTIENSSWIYRKVRSLSAAGKRLEVPNPANLVVQRSKSTPPEQPIRRISLASSATSSLGSRPESEISRPGTGKNSRASSAKSTERSLSPNKMFFDRSQSAYELRRELKRLAKTRKQRADPDLFSMETALRDQKQHYLESRARVAEYLDRLKKEEWYKPDRRAYVIEEL